METLPAEKIAPAPGIGGNAGAGASEGLTQAARVTRNSHCVQHTL